MAYQTRDFGKLLGMPGFSETALKNHFTLYQGYVANTNRIAAMAEEMTRARDTGSPASAELRRRFGWEWDGMRLHELYFGNLGGKGALGKGGPLATALAAAFGSVEAWEADFRTAGAMRGIGWVILYRDPATGALFNNWIGEHDGGHLAGCTPLLVMDVFEHAYLADYGLARADYIAAFFANINWNTVEERL
jgi:Fe-Mn family superoxide dismutase